MASRLLVVAVDLIVGWPEPLTLTLSVDPRLACLALLAFALWQRHPRE